MKCRSCGRDFLCDGHCANFNSLWGLEDWNNFSDRKKEKIQNERKDWKSPKTNVCTCDDCKNRLIDKNGKPCGDHCEEEEIKVAFD